MLPRSDETRVSHRSFADVVYEFMPNGTLRDWLSAKAKRNLNFGMRLRIALGSAKGILYLHIEANPPVFHRDIKASNILLDSNLNAKVSDFGLSRLAPVLEGEGEMPNHVSTVVKGTPGYLDPEYFLTHKLTDKSDVYRLGVVFLELLTGMQPIWHGKNIVRELVFTKLSPELQRQQSREATIHVGCGEAARVRTQNDASIRLFAIGLHSFIFRQVNDGAVIVCLYCGGAFPDILQDCLHQGNSVIDGIGTEEVISVEDDNKEMATGLGAVPFFFVELDPHWAGICNGMAAGVMLAASFDLIQEGQEHGAGSWFLEQYGEVSMLDIKGADATKVVLIVGIMTLHSFGEGSGVGVSFAGSKGVFLRRMQCYEVQLHPYLSEVSTVFHLLKWEKGRIKTTVAVPSFICADAFNKFLSFCTGFAAGCMIWMAVDEVLPDAFKEALPTPVASAATLSVALMEALSTLFQNFSHDFNSANASGFVVSLLFGLGPLLGGLVLVAFALAFCLQHAFLMGTASGIAFILGAWRPLQLLLSSKMGFLPLMLLLTVGAAFVHVSSSAILVIVSNKRTSNNLPTLTRFPVSVLTLKSFLACGTVAFHALAEGLELGVAGPKAYGLGRHMVLPVPFMGFPVVQQWPAASLELLAVGMALSQQQL
ncbi:putative zinc transporter [Hibiscus syriacus]|uniref:Zinc transporter n=1 Tax=Hibiscus syriacus TaxID=106335 RepID=A0A6A3B8K6_HIBSY|nr:putative zinc transporter [Hibiscus syriacus]